MKLITRDTDYAIRAITCIAGSKKKTVSVSVLAQELNIPHAFLRKIFQTLNKAGLLRSYKGKGGGFTLTVKPSKITIFDLIEIFQGSFQLNEHVFKGKTCPNIRICKLKKKIDKLEDEVIANLRTITIESLMKKK